MPAQPGPLRRAWFIVPSLIVSLLAGVGGAIADDAPATPPAPTATPALTPKPVPWAKTVPWPGALPWAQAVPWPGPLPWPETALWAVPPLGYIRTIEKTMDETHAKIERGILKETVRFDRFFGTVKPERLVQTRYDIRLRTSLRIEHEGGTVTPGATIRANFTLSRISERLRLFVARENEPGVTTQSLPQDPGYPGFDRTTPTAHFTNTELRYELIHKPTLDIFLGVGFRLALPLEAFARSRLEYTHKLGNVSLMRTSETFFVRSTDLIGETTEFSLERALGSRILVRWSNAATASKEINGLEWGSELSLFQQISPKDAITLQGGVYGHTTSPALVENFQVLARYRRNFLRNWLFYEVEPQVSWPRSPTGSYPAIVAVILRLEIGFQETTAGKQ